MSERIYIHEIVDVIGHNKKKYVDYMCEYAPTARTEKGVTLFGIWATVGSTCQWPTAVNLWEAKDWAGMAGNFAAETAGASLYDPKLMAWMGEAVNLRSGGFDRIGIAAPFSPLSEQAAADPRIVGAKVFYHETVKVQPGRAREYLDQIAKGWLPIAQGLGMTLAFAMRTGMSDDSEVILIYAIQEWATWGKAEHEMDRSPAVAAWRRGVQEMQRERQAFLMCSGSVSPLLTGKVL